MVTKKVSLKKKTAKKKIVKTAVKKSAKIKAPTKKIVKKLVAKIIKKSSKPVKLGKVIHYYNHIKVGIVKLLLPVGEGQNVKFFGATTDFSQVIKSMQINHVQVKKAGKGKMIGMKVSKRVREGDLMYKA